MVPEAAEPLRGGGVDVERFCDSCEPLAASNCISGDSFDGAVTTLLLGSAHFLDAYRCGVAGLDVLISGSPSGSGMEIECSPRLLVPIRVEAGRWYRRVDFRYACRATIVFRLFGLELTLLPERLRFGVPGLEVGIAPIILV